MSTNNWKKRTGKDFHPENDNNLEDASSDPANDTQPWLWNLKNEQDVLEAVPRNLRLYEYAKIKKLKSWNPKVW